MSGSMSAVELTVGEVRRRKFRLRKNGQRDFWPVQDASEIRLELWADGEDPFLPILALRESGYDDWNAGLVTFIISPLNATMRSKTYQQKIIAVIGGEEIIFPGDVADVAPRTTARFTLPEYGSLLAADEVMAASATGVIAPGMPVTLNADGTVSPAAQSSSVAGFSLNAADGGYTTLYTSAGWIMLSTWAPIGGSQYLPMNAPLVVGSTPGSLVAASAGQTPVATSSMSGLRLSFG